MKNVLFLIAAFVFSISANAQTKDGKMMDMDKDMTMSDGTVCMMDGTCKMKNGKTMKMKNGDKSYMDGKMRKMKMDKMANRITVSQ